MDQEILNMNVAEYKKYHESYMADHHGSTATHTFFCIAFTVQCALYCSVAVQHSGPVQYVLEYTFIVLPMILAHTVLVDHIYFLNWVIFTMLIINFVKNYNKLRITEIYLSNNNFHSNRVSSISCFRGLTYLITVFAILAVDFKSFPRYLAKTENYGYSLMDTGVGLFVLMSGLVHKDLRKERLVTILKGNIKFISVMFGLGIARFISVKQLDYQEHVTEYGVHWNFFFTLAVSKLLSTVILYYCTHPLVSSIVILLLHESLLYASLQEWVFGDVPRTDLFSANKEGLSSSLGYVSLYVFAAYMKSMICDKTVSRYSIQIRLVMMSVILSLLAYISDIYRPCSRTLANTGYCLFIANILVICMTVMYSHEVLFQNNNFKFKIPLILSAINSNGLLYFLGANLFTGTINLSLRTLSVPAFETFLILNLYMIITIVFVVYLKHKRIIV